MIFIWLKFAQNNKVMIVFTIKKTLRWRLVQCDQMNIWIYNLMNINKNDYQIIKLLPNFIYYQILFISLVKIPDFGFWMDLDNLGYPRHNFIIFGKCMFVFLFANLWVA